MTSLMERVPGTARQRASREFAVITAWRRSQSGTSPLRRISTARLATRRSTTPPSPRIRHDTALVVQTGSGRWAFWKADARSGLRSESSFSRARFTRQSPYRANAGQTDGNRRFPRSRECNPRSTHIALNWRAPYQHDGIPAAARSLRSVLSRGATRRPAPRRVTRSRAAEHDPSVGETTHTRDTSYLPATLARRPSSPPGSSSRRHASWIPVTKGG